MNRNIFIWCDSETDVKHLLLHQKENIYISSNNFDASAFCVRRHGWKYVEINVDINAAQDTSHIIDGINEAIHDAGIGSYSNLYEMGYIVEGGEAQTIYDFLFYLKNFNKILTKNLIEEIIVSTEVHQAYLALHTIALAKGIKFKKHNSIFVRKIAISAYMDNNPLFVKSYRKFVQNNVLKKIRSIAKRSKIKKIDCDVALFSSWISAKHINWNLKLLDLIDKNITIGVFSFTGDQYNEDFINKGYAVVNTEAWFDEEQAKTSIKAWKENCDKIEKKGREINRIIIDGIDITRPIWANYQRYLYKHVFLTIIYRGMVHNMLNDVFFKAGLVPIDSNYALNRVLYYTALYDFGRDIYLCNDEAQILPYAKPIYIVREPYKNAIKFRFYPRPDDLGKFLDSSSDFEGKVIWVPMGGKSKKINIANVDNLQIITHKPRILWCPSNVLVGYDSFIDYEIRSDTVIHTCCELGLDVFIKYHPGQSMGQTKKFMNKYAGMQNIHFVDQKSSIEPLYKKADIIISDLSTTLFEGAYIGKATISILTPFLRRRAIPGITENFLVTNIHTFKDTLISLIDSMTGNGSADFYKQVIKKQYEFLEPWYSNDDYVSLSDAIKIVLDTFDKQSKRL